MQPDPKRCLYCKGPFGLISHPSNTRMYCSKKCWYAEEHPPDELIELLQYPP